MKILIFLCLLTSLLRFLKAHPEITEDLVNFYKPLESFVELKGGKFLMGVNDRDGVNNEYPQRQAAVKPFRIMLYPTTTASFHKFKMYKRQHRTDAERHESSWVFNKLINSLAEIDVYKNVEEDEESRAAKEREMSLVMGARWNRPTGGNSSTYNTLSDPVVHVSYTDAFYYCAWKGMRLPTEIEWEFAARGGLEEKEYPWGEQWELNRTNLWQGSFPDGNQLRDGYFGLSPVDAFRAQNNYGMFDLIGNVWEWTSTRYEDNGRVLKGGSFLDERDGGNKKEDRLRIRISARIGRQEKYSAQNVGFRCVQSIPEREINFNGNEKSRIVRLRAPIHHHLNSNDSHPIVKQHIKTEL